MKINVLNICFTAALAVMSSLALAHDDKSMTPPPGVNNKTLNAMVGNWEGEGDMQGMKMHDNIKIYWSLNHHYLMMELHSRGVDNPKVAYEGLGVFGVDDHGNVKTWWFDSWGPDAISTGTGTAAKDKLELHDSNNMFKEVRTFTIKGNAIEMTAKGSMNMNGKETAFNQVVTYQKK